MRITENVEILHWDTEWEEIPKRIRLCFSKDEELFYRNIKERRKRWIDTCKCRHVKRFLKNLMKNDHFRVYIKSKNGAGPFIHWFVSFVVENDGISVRLPVDVTLPGKPSKGVAELYKYIGGVDEKLEYFRGWVAPELIEPLPDLENPIAKDCYVVFRIGNGDAVGYVSGGGGFLFEHEKMTIKDFDIERFIVKYFGDFFNRNEALPD
jgi:hypothetical protein